MQPLKVALIDDDPVFRKFVTALLRRMPEVELVDVWESSEAMLADPRFQEVELLLVDLELPGVGGLELISHLNQIEDPPSCVVLTVSHAAEDVFKAIRNGASGYLIKSGDLQTFQESLKQVIQEGVGLSPKIARLLVEQFRQITRARGGPASRGGISSLTARELEVLKGLAKFGSAKDVGRELGLSHETVRVHMKKTYQKLHVNTKAEALALLDKYGK